MAQYKVLVKSFINNSLYEVDSIVEFDGTPSDNLEPIDKAAIKAAKASEGSNQADVERMKLAAAGGDPSTLDATPAGDQLV